MRVRRRLRRCENGNVNVNVSCLIRGAPPSLKDSNCEACVSGVVTLFFSARSSSSLILSAAASMRSTIAVIFLIIGNESREPRDAKHKQTNGR